MVGKIKVNGNSEEKGKDSKREVEKQEEDQLEQQEEKRKTSPPPKTSSVEAKSSTVRGRDSIPEAVGVSENEKEQHL
ncbi:UNVERIFIED_CONTAM: hypothetical protein FKN15_015197 [Acipenser sinensis]